MWWSLLPYAVPLFEGLQALAAIYPGTYRKYLDAPESTHASLVKTVAKRVLNGENQEGSTYHARVDEMIDEMPDPSLPKNVTSVIASRFKVVSIRNEMTSSIHSEGVDVDMGSNIGKFFVGIDPDISPEAVEALPWIATHEICHFLEGDWVEIPSVKVVGTLSAVILSSAFFGWAWPTSTQVAVIANIVTHGLVSQYIERRADAFANKHCSDEEKRKAIVFLEKIQSSYVEGIFGRLAKGVRFFTHPSIASRIASIQQSSILQEKEKVG